MSLDASADAGPVATVDHAVARLTTDVGRLDAIDLDAPWDASRRSRRELLVELVSSLDAASAPDDASHGWPVATALQAAWTRRREALLAEESPAATRATVDILAAIHDVHVALDVGVRRHDLQAVGGDEA